MCPSTRLVWVSDEVSQQEFDFHQVAGRVGRDTVCTAQHRVEEGFDVPTHSLNEYGERAVPAGQVDRCLAVEPDQEGLQRWQRPLDVRGYKAERPRDAVAFDAEHRLAQPRQSLPLPDLQDRRQENFFPAVVGVLLALPSMSSAHVPPPSTGNLGHRLTVWMPGPSVSLLRACSMAAAGAAGRE